MKHFNFLLLTFIVTMLHVTATAQTNASTFSTNTGKSKKLFMDVHRLGAGKVKFADVAAAHVKDLAVQKKYNVACINYWVDSVNGNVYCLAAAYTAEDFRSTHAEAHGLLPDEMYEVSAGVKSAIKNAQNLYMDVHEFGPGNVTAAAVAEAHKKDLAVQKKHGVNFINYWVDEKKGVVICLCEAKDPAAIIAAHKEAHGLLPQQVVKVQQGE